MISPLKEKKLIYVFDLSILYGIQELLNMPNKHRLFELITMDVLTNMGIIVKSFDYNQHELDLLVRQYRLNRNYLRDQVLSIIQNYFTSINHYDDTICYVNYDSDNVIVKFVLKDKK